MRFLEILKLYRFKNFRAYLLIFFLGFISLGDLKLLLTKEFFLLTISMICYLAFGFSVNECFDVEEDKAKGKKTLVTEGKICFKECLLLSSIPLIIGIFISFRLGIKVFLYFLLMNFFGFFYSAKPIRFKSKPFFDLITHSLFLGSLILIYPAIAFEKIPNPILIFSITLHSIIFELRNHLEDYEADRRAGVKTTVVFLGKKKSEKLTSFLCKIYPIFLILLFHNFPLLLPLIFLISLIYLYKFSKTKNYRIFDYYSNLVYLIFSIIVAGQTFITPSVFSNF